MTSISVQAAQARETAREADGKFGHRPHDRADGIDLTAGQADPDDVIEKARAAARRERLSSLPSLDEIRRQEAPSDDELTASKEMLARVQRIARREEKGYDPAYDASDAAADAILELNKMHREGKLRDPDQVPNAMIAKIIVASRMKNGQLSSRHTTAISAYNSALRERETALGRGLNRKERGELSEQVRSKITPKNRPPAGYHEPVRTDSLDARIDSSYGGPEYDAVMTSAPDPYRYVTDPENGAKEDAIGDIEDAIQRATAEGAITRQDLSRRPWEAAAMLFESGHPDSVPLPPVAERGHKPSEINRASADLRARGGATKAARDYLDGITADDPALFAPFSDDLSDDQMHTVAEFVVHLSDHLSEEKANKIHTTALSTSRTDSGSTTGRVRDALDLGGAR